MIDLLKVRSGNMKPVLHVHVILLKYVAALEDPSITAFFTLYPSRVTGGHIVAEILYNCLQQQIAAAVLVMPSQCLAKM